MRRHVAVHLVDQVVDRLEAHLAAQVGDELDPGRLAVEVAVEVEEVGLQQGQVGFLVEGGPPPEGQGGRPADPVGPQVPAGVDAVGGQGDQLRHGHVGGREAQLAGPAGRPRVTTPRTWWGRPSRAAASSTAPAASSSRIRVDDTGWPPGPAPGTAGGR